MERFTKIEDKLNEAFKLAYFIHGDRETARCIALAATTKLDAAVAAQDKRYYYQAQSRNRVSLGEEQLLQRLVYVESEPYERNQEQASSAINEGILIIHFIKHLVRVTLKRTSFYVTLGMSRVLRNYSTRETMEIYHAIVQDPGVVRDDSYYRSRKGVLIRELKKRFGDLISLCQGPRHETLFKVQADSSRYVELIRRCLTEFTPWVTDCIIPVGFNPVEQELSSLSCHHSDPDEGHQTEVARMHALLHPICYQRLIEGLHSSYINELSFDDPDKKLQIPQFNAVQNGNNGNGSHEDREQTVELSAEELAILCQELAAEAARRKQWGRGLLRILVDGEERARFNPREVDTVAFRIADGEEVIEIYGQGKDAETLLAVQLLTYDDDLQTSLPPEFILRLARDQELDFALMPERDSEGEFTAALVEVAYREIGVLQSVLRWRHQLGKRLSGLWKTQSTAMNRMPVSPNTFGPAIKYIFAPTLVLAVLGCSLLLAKVWQLQDQLDQIQAQQAQQSTSSVRQTTGKQANAAQTEQPNLPVISLALTSSLVRETGKIERLVLPSDASQITILLKLPTDNYQRYRAVVFQVDERVEVLTQDITTDVTIDGGRWVVLTLPSSKLSIGDYQVKLGGAISNGEFEDIGKYPFNVRGN